jgi:hypothetical protein
MAKTSAAVNCEGEKIEGASQVMKSKLEGESIS